jgi:hypothetical protein
MAANGFRCKFVASAIASAYDQQGVLRSGVDSPTAGGKHQAREALKRVAAGEPLREIASSYSVDHSTNCRLTALHAAEA